jgi:thiamine pyrophosphokinase
MRGLLVGNAPGVDHRRVAKLAASAEFVIAVDGGLRAVQRADVRPDLIVGDLDSADPAVLEGYESSGVPVERHPAAKDESDLELALAAARAHGVSRIALTGVVGGRLDHTLAGLGALCRAADLWPRIDEKQLSAWVMGRQGRRALALAGVGGTVSAMAVGKRARARSAGLRWPLAGVLLDPLSSRGLSNMIESEPAVIEWRAGCLVVMSSQVDGVGPAVEVGG